MNSVLVQLFIGSYWLKIRIFIVHIVLNDEIFIEIFIWLSKLKRDFYYFWLSEISIWLSKLKRDFYYFWLSLSDFFIIFD